MFKNSSDPSDLAAALFGSRPENVGEALRRLLLYGVPALGVGALIGAAPGVARNMRLIEDLEEQTRKKRDVDVDLTVPVVKQGAITDPRTFYPLIILNTALSLIAGQYLGKVTENRVSHAMIDRELAKAKRQFHDSLLRHMVVSQDIEGANPFSPYIKKAIWPFTENIIPDNLVVPYLMYSALAIPAAWYVTHRALAKADAKRLKMERVEEDAAKMMGSEYPSTQVGLLPVSPATRDKIIQWVKNQK